MDGQSHTNTVGETAGVPLRPRIGLALGAGAARGWAHIGVIRSLLDTGVVPDVIAGTSIGAVVGGAYSCGALDALEDWANSLKRIGFFRFLDFKLRGGGLFGGQHLGQLMDEHFGPITIDALERPFVAVGCELKTGHEVWMNNGSLTRAVRASFALPGVFEPVKWNGRWLVDGALVNPVPVSVCRALGAEIVIAVNLSEDIYGRARALREGAAVTGQYGVFSDIEAAAAEKGKRGSKTLMRQLFKQENDAPSLFANMLASLNIIQNRLSRSRLAGEPPDVTILPSCGHIGLMEFHRADEAIAEGRRAFEMARQSLDDALAIIGYRMNQD